MNSGSSSNSRDACNKDSKSRWTSIKPMRGTWLRSAITDGTSSIPRSWHRDRSPSVNMSRAQVRNSRSPRGSTSRRKAAGSATALFATWLRADRSSCRIPASARTTRWAKAWCRSAQWEKPPRAPNGLHETIRGIAAPPARSPRIFSIRIMYWADSSRKLVLLIEHDCKLEQALAENARSRAGSAHYPFERNDRRPSRSERGNLGGPSVFAWIPAARTPCDLRRRHSSGNLESARNSSGSHTQRNVTSAA